MAGELRSGSLLLSFTNGGDMLSQLGLRARRRELIWILVVNEEDVWSEASPFLRGTVMKAAEDLLLIP